MRRTPALVATLALLLSVTACGGDDQDKKQPEAKDTEMKGSAQCNRLLPRAKVERLAGGEVLDPEDVVIGGLDACKWGGVSDPGASVTVVRTPAEQWAEKLPPLIDQYERTGALENADKAKIKRARQLIEAGGIMDGKQACGVFTTMLVELQKLPAGSTRVINWLPNKAKPQAVNIQTCEDGRYTSVQLIAGGLKGIAAEEDRLTETYDELPS